MKGLETAKDFFELALKRSECGDYHRSIDAFIKALALNKNWQSYQGLGWALVNTQKYQAAIEAFNKSLALHENWSTYQGLGWALGDSQQYQPAIEAFNKSLALHENWSTYQGLGWALGNMQQYQPAIEAFNKSLALHEHWDSYHGLGLVSIKADNYQEAINALKKACTLNDALNIFDKHTMINHNKRFLIDIYEYKEIIDNLSESAAINEDQVSYFGLGWAFYNTKQYTESIDAFRKSIAIKEDRISYFGLGWALYEKKQFTEATEAFRSSEILRRDSGSYTDDAKLLLLIGASTYSSFERRVVTKSVDIMKYTRIKNDLEGFIHQTPWETECLYRYATLAKQGIVEIGRYNGGSTLVFSLSNPQTKIASIDISPQDDEKLKNIFVNTNSGKNVDLLIGDANEVYDDVIKSGFRYDFLFIDGDHSYEGCMKDIKTWFPSLSQGGIVVFHDSNWRSVFQAIIEFAKHNDMNFIVPPSSTSRHWENTNGSLCIAYKGSHPGITKTNSK